MSTVTGQTEAQERLSRTIAGILGIPPAAIDDATSPEVVGSWDSLNHLNLVMALEQEFAVALSVDEALEMRSVGLIRSVLARHGISC